MILSATAAPREPRTSRLRQTAPPQEFDEPIAGHRFVTELVRMSRGHREVRTVFPEL